MWRLGICGGGRVVSFFVYSYHLPPPLGDEEGVKRSDAPFGNDMCADEGVDTFWPVVLTEPLFA